MTLSSRPTPVPAPPGGWFSSKFGVGDIVAFKPQKLVYTSPVEVVAKVVRVSFEAGKVLYDLALIDAHAPTGFYEEYPVRSVDSIFIEWPAGSGRT